MWKEATAMMARSFLTRRYLSLPLIFDFIYFSTPLFSFHFPFYIHFFTTLLTTLFCISPS